MAKRIIQQARGKGSPRYKSPSFNFKGKISYAPLTNELVLGKVMDLIDCPGHHAPLMKVDYDNGRSAILAAPEGICVGQAVETQGTTINRGNVVRLQDIPSGIPVFNIESRPGDGGKFCRTSGTFAKIVDKTESTVTIQLPSKKRKVFSNQCRASIGVIAGAGRPEKPFLKAGKKFHQMKAKNKLYPRSSASAMNAIDHPYGNKRTSRKAHQKPVNRFAPPGRKVGKLWPKQTGKRK
jgi:large subunit ribosomal protein L2